MPETTESGGKASDLFLGVVDLFAVILPGALFTVTLWKAVSIRHNDLLLKLALPEVIPKWLAFLLVSYILGHFLFAISSWIMDPLYDGYYKRKYEFEFKKELPSLRRRADRLFGSALGDNLYREDDNRLTWGESFLRVGNAAASAELDRLEADSKFFRSLATVAILSVPLLFSPLTFWISIHQWYLVLVGFGALLLLVFLVRGRLTKKAEITEKVKRCLVGNSKPQPTTDKLPPRLSWSDEEWMRAEKAVCKEDAGKFRRYALSLPLVWLLFVLLLACYAWEPLAFLAGILYWLLAIVSAKRFMEIRAKRLAQAYYFVIALNKMSSFNDKAMLGDEHKSVPSTSTGGPAPERQTSRSEIPPDSEASA